MPPVDKTKQQHKSKQIYVYQAQPGHLAPFDIFINNGWFELHPAELVPVDILPVAILWQTFDDSSDKSLFMRKSCDIITWLQQLLVDLRFILFSKRLKFSVVFLKWDKTGWNLI